MRDRPLGVGQIADISIYGFIESAIKIMKENGETSITMDMVHDKYAEMGYKVYVVVEKESV